MRVQPAIVLIATAAFALSLGSTASAQYFEERDARGGYLPDDRPHPQSGYDLSLAGPGNQRTPLRFGLAIDFGGAGARLANLDESFHGPNDAAEFGGFGMVAWDVSGFMEFNHVFRVGLVGGGLHGAPTNRDADFTYFGLQIEGGYRGFSGWGAWLGVDFGYGRMLTTSRDSNFADDGIPGFYDYEARGLGLRISGRVEREISPFLSLRLSPFVQTIIPTTDEYTVNIADTAPAPVLPGGDRGRYLAYGATFGIVFHSF